MIVRRLAGSARTYQFDPRGLSRAYERMYRQNGRRELVVLMSVLGLSTAEVGRLFHVKRQAVEKWLDTGVPQTRLAQLGHVTDVAKRLQSTFRPERLPAIVRQANPGLGGETALAALAQPDGVVRVMAALDRLTSYVPTSA